MHTGFKSQLKTGVADRSILFALKSKPGITLYVMFVTRQLAVFTKDAGRPFMLAGNNKLSFAFILGELKVDFNQH